MAQQRIESRAGTEQTVRMAHDLRVVVSRLRRRLKDAAEQFDLTPTQASVISRLSRDGSASISDLAAAERVRHQSMAATVAGLERRGVLARRPDPGDGRRQIISLTDESWAALSGSREARDAWLARELREHLSADERDIVEQALSLLERLVD